MQAPVVYLDQRILVLADMDIMERNASLMHVHQTRVKIWAHVILLVDRATTARVHLDGMDQYVISVLAFQTRVTIVVYVLHLDPTRITAHANLVIQEQLASKIKTPAMVAVELSVVRTIVNVTSTVYTMGIAVSTKCITVTVANCTCINCIV
ncbi:uncharacterized protein [Mytilus edulis]|uniref:uncharacterized protein n=1 Tax=Mytilus edulis TaxID=6550 RepID=UPI0039EEC2A3